MDGNGRWANKHGKTRIEGHKQGAEAARKTIISCISNKIKYLTLFAFSSENWSRPLTEVDALMGLLKLYITKEISELKKNGVRLTFVGNRDALDQDLQKSILSAENSTKENIKLNLIIALNYGGREEIVRATKSLIQKYDSGIVTLDEITPDLVSSELYTYNLPDPDLIIRTSGEQRLSNFLLWQCAYSEFVFVKEYWPDFNESILKRAIKVYKTRNRRYGRVK